MATAKSTRPLMFLVLVGLIAFKMAFPGPLSDLFGDSAAVVQPTQRAGYVAFTGAR